MRLVVAGLVVVASFLMYQYIYMPLPPDMDQKWTVRIIDAILRTSGHLVCMVGIYLKMKTLIKNASNVSVGHNQPAIQRLRRSNLYLSRCMTEP